MSRFARITEDPSYFYDEDGICVDEDFELLQSMFSDEQTAAPVEEELSPFGTVNS